MLRLISASSQPAGPSLFVGTANHAARARKLSSAT